MCKIHHSWFLSEKGPDCWCMLSIVQVNCLKLYTTYTLSVEVDCYVLIFVILDNNYWHFFLMLYIWKTSYLFYIFPVSCFIWSTVSFSWPPRFCKRTDYSTGWLQLICSYFKMSKLNYLFEVSQFLFVVVISLRIIRKCMVVTSPWLTMTIWRKWASIVLLSVLMVFYSQKY